MVLISVFSQTHNKTHSPTWWQCRVGHWVMKADTPRILNLSLKNLSRIPCPSYHQKSQPEDGHLWKGTHLSLNMVTLGLELNTLKTAMLMSHPSKLCFVIPAKTDWGTDAKKKKIRVMDFHPFWGRDSWPMWSNIESLSNESAPQNHCIPGTKAEHAVCSSLIYFWSYLWNIFLKSFKMVTQIIWQRPEHTQQRTNRHLYPPTCLLSTSGFYKILYPQMLTFSTKVHHFWGHSNLQLFWILYAISNPFVKQFPSLFSSSEISHSGTFSINSPWWLPEERPWRVWIESV